MNWQSALFTVGGVIFTLALLPSLFGPHKPSIWSSILTGSILTLFSLAYFTLGWIEPGCATASTAVCWWLLAIQEGKNESFNLWR